MKVKKTNNFPILLVLSILVFIAAVGTIKVVSGQTSSFPVVSRVCEEQTGGLYAIDDNYSRYVGCKNRGREVILGVPTTPASVMGYLHQDGDTVYFLTLDRRVLRYQNGEWVGDSPNIPSEIDTSTIMAFEGHSLLDNAGNIWIFNYQTNPNGWVKAAKP